MRYDKMLFGKTIWVTGLTTLQHNAYLALFKEHGANIVFMGVDDLISGALEGQPSAERDRRLEDFCGDTLAEFGAPDVWLCALDYYATAYLEDTSDKMLEVMLEASVIIPFAIMRFIAPRMIENGGGSVVFINSEYAIQNANRVSAYGASKGGQRSLADAFAMEYAAKGIRVNSIAAGVSFPPIGDDILKQSGAAVSADDAEFWGTVQPFTRRGEPRELADAALFFASDMSDYITGETLFVNGAEHLVSHNHIFPSKERVYP